MLKAVLFDMDGVLYVGDEAIEGAAEAVRFVKESELAVAAVTNTTTQPKREIAEKLSKLGIPLNHDEIFTPAALAVQIINVSTAKLFVREALLEDFRSVKQTYEKPDYLVMGDIGGEGYPPETLLEIFGYVLAGSKLLALHKNRFWQKPDGLHLDLGTFVAAIEYASGTTATVLGKPAADFFNAVCHALAVNPSEAMMIGDDIESDIGGAKASGLQTTLVRTGKYRQEFVENSGIKADMVLASVAELPGALKRLLP